MAINEYDIGDVVRITGTFNSTVSTATPLDPSKVSFWVKAPSSTVATYTSTQAGIVLHPSTGVYYTDFVVSTTGLWQYRIFSTGTGQTAEDDQFRVQTPLVASTGT